MPTTIDAPEAVETESSLPTGDAANEMIDRVLGESAVADAPERDGQERREESQPEADDSGDSVTDTEPSSEAAGGKDAQATEPSTYVDPELATRAIRAGLEYSDVVAFPSRDALARAVAAIERTQGQADGKDIGAEQKAAELKLPEPLDPALHSEEEIARDNFYREQMKAMHDKFLNMEQSMGQVANSQRAQQITERVSWFDDQVSKLGEEFEPHLGKGRVHEVDPQFIPVRDSLLATTDLFQVNLNVSKEQAFAMAKYALFGEQMEKLVTTRIRNEIKARSKQRAGTGSGRSTRFTDAPPHDGELAKDPVLKEAYAKLQRENGQ